MIVCEVDETGKPASFETRAIEIAPATAQQVEIDYVPYGEDYIEALHAIHDGWSEQRRREACDERVQVAVWHCGEYSGAVTIAHPLLGETAHHWASIDFRGVRITQDVFLGDAGKLDHLPALLVEVMRDRHVSLYVLKP